MRMIGENDRSMRMIVGEDAVCWHSLSERLVLCLANFSVIDHSVLCSALKMKLTENKALLLTQRWAAFFQK